MKPVFDWVLLAFGAVLSLVGLYWMWSGWDIVQIERGWVSVISGAIMLSGGVMVSALAYGVMTLRAAMPAVSRAPEHERDRPPLPDILRPRPPESDAEPPVAEAAPVRERPLGAALARPAAAVAATAASAAALAAKMRGADETDSRADSGAADAGDEPSLDETPEDVSLAEAAVEEALALPLDEKPEPDSDEAQQEFDARETLAQETRAAAPPPPLPSFGRWFRRNPAPAPPVEETPETSARTIEDEVTDALGLQPGKSAATSRFEDALNEVARAQPAGDRDNEESDKEDRDKEDRDDEDRAWRRRADQERPDEDRAEALRTQDESGDDDKDEFDREFARELHRSEAPPALAPAAPEPPPKPEPAILGRHTSGDTTYTMFADGSIEAETPDGVLRFDSLIELRRHVEKIGGE